MTHEKACKKNPENINACVGCKFLGVDEVDKYTDSFDGNFGMDTLVTFNVFRCKKLNQNMYPAKAKRKIKDYPESFEGKVQMPNSCEHYEAEIIDDDF